MKKRVVVIGGSSGIGLAIAKELSKNRYDLVIASRSLDKLEKAKKDLKNAKAYAVNLKSENEIKELFSKIGPFDHLIITAADFVMGPFLKMKTDVAKGFFDSKFWGQYISAKYGAQKLKQGGSILFFCGSAGQRPFPHFSAGSAINAAIEGLTRALAIELSPIRVNAISPGTIETPVWDLLGKKAKEAALKKAAQKLLVQRVGTPADVSRAALYLIECGYATGSIVHVDGGERLI